MSLVFKFFYSIYKNLEKVRKIKEKIIEKKLEKFINDEYSYAMIFSLREIILKFKI